MIKIILLTLVLLNTLGLLVCDDQANQNTAKPTSANTSLTANVMATNGNLTVDANGNVIANGSNSFVANANFGMSQTGSNTSSVSSSGSTMQSTTGGNTAGPDAGNMAPMSTPR